MTIHSTISQSLMSHGTQSIDTAHAIERRLADAETRRTLALAHSDAAGTGLRHNLGTLIISLGAFIAGTTTTIHDRQATMPAPDPKPGLVPTR